VRSGPAVALASRQMDPHTRIDVPYADAQADELSYVLGLGALEALKTLSVRVAGFRCELRILGCSHQVLVEDGELLSETVACLPAPPASAQPLPAAHELTLPGAARYRIRSHVGALSEAADPSALLDRHAADPRGLVGVFPGHAHAFTALSARELPGGGVTWETFHAYPQSGELVHTHSTLEPLTR
jgi:hypothetical protein